MRIVIITEFFPVSTDEGPTGGVEQRVSQLVSRLQDDVVVLCSHQPGQPRQHRYGTTTVRRVGPTYPYSHAGDIVRRLGFAMAAWWAAVTMPRAAVIEGSSFLSYLPAALAGLMAGVPTMATYHECWLGQWIRNKGVATGTFGTIWERLSLLIGFDAVIAVSESTSADLRRHGVKNIVVLPNGVDTKAFISIKRRKPNVATIVHVGRLVPTKNVDILLRSAALVQKSIPLRCEIIGEGTERQALEALARSLNVDARFRGFVKSSRDVYEIVAASTVLCLLSSVEGFGISVVEAMKCGVPVVVSDIPPLREVVAEGKAGVLVPLRDVQTTANALRALLTDNKRQAALVEAGRDRCIIYDWDGIAVEYRAIIGTLASRSRR